MRRTGNKGVTEMSVRKSLCVLTFLTACVAPTFFAGRAAAQAPDVTSIVKRMKEAVEPPRAMAAQIAFTVSAGQESTEVTLGLARAKHERANRLLLVALTPVDLRGTAYLIEDAGPDGAPQWVYVPAVRRIRKVVAPEAFTAFLNSDFTYFDLGFVDLQADYTLLGTDESGGKLTYRVQSVPKQRFYYSKIVTLVDGKTFLPIEREYYDVNGTLWKKQRWEHVTVIDGIATPVQITMQDVQANTSSTIHIREVRYGANVPDELVTPEGLPNAADAPLWKSLGEAAQPQA